MSVRGVKLNTAVLSKTKFGRKLLQKIKETPEVVSTLPEWTKKPDKRTVYLAELDAHRAGTTELLKMYRKDFEADRAAKKEQLKRKWEEVQASKAARIVRQAPIKEANRAAKAKHFAELAELKAVEREGYAKNRILWEKRLKERQLTMINKLAEEREKHWIRDFDAQLDGNIFDTTAPLPTGYWVTSPIDPHERPDAHGPFGVLVNSKEGRAMDTDDEDELALLDFRGINNPRRSFHGMDAQGLN